MSTKVSALPQAASFEGTDKFYVVDGTISKYIIGSDLANSLGLLDATATITAYSGSVKAKFFDMTYNPSQAATATMYAVHGKTTFGGSLGSTSGNVGGVMGQAVYNCTATVADMVAVNGKLTINSGKGTLTEGSGVRGRITSLGSTATALFAVQANVTAHVGTTTTLAAFGMTVDAQTGTITNLCGLDITALANAGTVTNFYGVRIANQPNLSGTKRAIKIEDGDAHIETIGKVIGASGSEFATPPHPGIASNRYYWPYGQTSLTAVAMVANTLYASPFFVPERTTWTRIGINVTSAVGGTSCRLGIYKAVGGVPTTKVLDAGEVSTATTGEKEITISQVLEAGMYFVAVVSDGAPTISFTTWANGIQAWMYGSPNVSDFAQGRITVAHTYAVLPTNFGTPTYGSTGNSPAVWMRKV